jgi:hypothetical protein
MFKSPDKRLSASNSVVLSSGNFLVDQKARATVAILYAALTVLPCVAIMFLAHLPLVRLITFVAYAFALLPTYYLDQWLFGGAGFHSLAIFGLFTLIVALVLWPLALLSVAPSAWASARWRRIFAGYGILFVSAALFAGWQMTKSWGLFFG